VSPDVIPAGVSATMAWNTDGEPTRGIATWTTPIAPRVGRRPCARSGVRDEYPLTDPAMEHAGRQQRTLAR
jgi:hypothetical protein